MTASPLTQIPQTNPLELFRLRDGLYTVDLLGAAIAELDFFTWLAGHPSTLEGICTALGLKPRPTDVMLTVFTALGTIRSEAGVFSITQLGREFLSQESPWCLGPYYLSLKERPVCKDMITVLRTGKPANFGSIDKNKEWAKAMETEDFARRFTAAMDCRGQYLGPAMARGLDLAGHRHLLDIAGGSGIYACAIAANHPHMRATVLEKRPVDAIARTLIAERGHANRVSVAVGNMFSDPLPGDCDVHLFSNVLHDWDEPLVRQLLAKSFAALPAGGLLVVHDAHINRDKTGPYPVAAYSALLMNITEGKCYSVGEMEDYLGAVGFGDIRFFETAADRSVMTARKAG